MGSAVARRRYARLLGCVMALTSGAEAAVMPERVELDAAGVTFERRAFSDLPGWRDDRHGQAFRAFRLSCARLDWLARERGPDALAEGSARARAHLAACRVALGMSEPVADDRARAFFETHFQPHEVVHQGRGFLTGYFEPELAGSRTPSARFHVPVYRKPDDLVVLIADEKRGTLDGQRTAARRTPEGEVDYHTRREIEQGALEGRRLEIVYLEDPVAAYVMHVQGSGRVALEDGTVLRLTYAAKNGHPYTSIGRLLIERGEIAQQDMSLETLTAWLRRAPQRARELMWQNHSYIFFREVADQRPDQGPIGAQSVSLTAGRSLAADPGFHALGTPIWVVAPTLDAHGEDGFHRLMVAQDAGSAIKGPERGDIFWGAGDAAGAVAGRTRHAGRFYVLYPRADLTGN